MACRVVSAQDWLLGYVSRAFIITYQMNQQSSKLAKNACPSSHNDEEDAGATFLPFDLLTINDHKNSFDGTEQVSCEKDGDSYYSLGSSLPPTAPKTDQQPLKKGKLIQKREKEHEDERKAHLNRKRRIALLESKVDQLEKEVLSLRRNEHFCRNCSQRSPDFYRDKISEIIHQEQTHAQSHSQPGVPGSMSSAPSSEGSLEFEKIDLHGPLMQTQEMEEKMWIFLGTMLIAMGSKVTDFDGTINTFRVLKNSVDRVRRQVEKGEPLVGMNFFCSKEEMTQAGSLIDGMSFDPFYSNKEDPTHGNFSLEGVKIESVEEYELFYDYKYDFNIRYDALLSIMEFARDSCSLS